MSILVGKQTRLVVQGITGREGAFHTRQMIDYGTPLVAGVTPGKGGESAFGTVPVFVGELKSLEILDLSYNDLQNDAPLDFLIKGFPRLRQIWLRERPGAPPRTPALPAHLEAFKAKLLAQNPDAEVIY